MKRITVLGLGLMMCLLAPLTAAGQQAGPGKGFDFYGVGFGMTIEEVGALFRLNPQGNEAVQPGHGMMFLTFDYDHQGKLMEMKASYQRPVAPLELAGLRLALQEKFIDPVVLYHRDVSASLDEYGNSAAVSVVFTSLKLREGMVRHFKEEALRRLQ